MPEETNIAYVAVVLVTLLTFKFQQIVRSWYSVQVTFVCIEKIFKNLFKKQSAKFVQNPSSFTKVMAKHILVCFYAPQCTLYYLYTVNWL